MAPFFKGPKGDKGDGTAEAIAAAEAAKKSAEDAQALVDGLKTDTGAAGVSYRLALPGTIRRTLLDRAGDIVPVTEFGATSGTPDATVAFQRALRSGVPAILVPPGIWNVGELEMPTTQGFTLIGVAGASRLRALGGTVLNWPKGQMAWPLQDIIDLTFEGTNGTNDLIDTQGAGNLRFQNLSLLNIPAGKSGIRVAGVGSEYTHDIDIQGLRIYHNSGKECRAGILCDSTTADMSVANFYMQGNFVANHCIEAVPGASSVRMSDSHIYNTKSNIALIQGVSGFSFTDVVFDNANEDLVYVQDSDAVQFSNCRYQAAMSGKNCITLNNAHSTRIIGGMADGRSGTNAVVYEFGSSDYNVVQGVAVSPLANFMRAWQLKGENSRTMFCPGDFGSALGVAIPLSGSSGQAVQPNTVGYLGPAGWKSNQIESVWVTGVRGELNHFYIASDQTAPAGTPILFDVQVNGATVGAGSISAGQYAVKIPLRTIISEVDVVNIRVGMPGGATPARFRYAGRFYG